MTMEIRTSLVIGGTGMLKIATQWLASHSANTVLVARHASSFVPLQPGVVPINADWNDPSFTKILTAALDIVPPIDRALLWLHEPAPVLLWLLPLLRFTRVVLVLGSTDGQPEIPKDVNHIATVRLGSMPTTHGRRWLTHNEISVAAVEALKDGNSRIVGELRSQ